MSATARRSIAAPSRIIRAEADLAPLCAGREEKVAVRIIHACGMVDVAADIVFAPGAVKPARRRWRPGAPILCDAKMVANGVTRARLPANNEVICTLDDPRVPALARGAGHHALGRADGAVARRGWAAPSSPSAMRRPRCSACSK